MELQAIRAGVKQRNENAISMRRIQTQTQRNKLRTIKNHEDEQNDEQGNHNPLKNAEQDEKVSAMKENILRKFETAKETPIDQRLPTPKINKK